MPITEAQGLEPLTEEQAIQVLRSNPQYLDIGPLTPYVDDRYGANGEGNGSVLTQDGHELVSLGNGQYGVPLSPTLTVNGRRGAYVGRYDQSGKMVEAAFLPEGTGFLDRYGWLAPLVPIAAFVVAPYLAGAGAAGGLSGAEVAGLAGVPEGVASGLGASELTGLAGIGEGVASGTAATDAAALVAAENGITGSTVGSTGMFAPEAVTAGTVAAETAAPISTGVGMTSLGTAPTLADIGTAIANGANLDNLGTAAINLLKSGGMQAINVVKAVVTNLGKSGSVVDQIASGLGITGGDTLSGLFTAGAGLAALGSLKSASNTAADQYGGLADSVKGQYQFLGDKAQGMFNGLGAQGQSEYNALGMRVGETYNNLADTYQQGYALLGDKVGTTYNNLATNTEGQYTNLANKATEQVGKFTPYNITTNVGTTNDKGTFTPTAGAQGISDSATKAAQSSFDAGNAIDVNNLTKQRYDQMQSIFAPGDAESLSRIQATEQARGRTGIQSLNQANELGGVGSNPAMVAYYKAQQDRNLKAQATAADQALAQRGGLLSQGSGAAAVPLNIANQGLQQLSTGAQIGNTAFQNNMAGTQLGTGIEKSGLDRGYDTRMRGVSDVTGLYQRGLDRGLDTRIRGADTVTGMFDKGIGYNLGQRAQGINNNLDLSARGISASTPLYAQQIGQRYQGNLAATNALFGVLGQLARATGKAAPANTGNATQMAADAIKLLTNIGMTEAEASAEIDRQLSAGEFSYGQDYSSSEDFINNFNSIFEG